MAWLDDVGDDQMPEMLADTLKTQRKIYGTVLNSTRQVAHVPQIVLGAGDMSRSFSRSQKVPARLAHLLNLRVGSIVGCPFWRDLHAAGSSADGIDDDIIHSVAEGTWRDLDSLAAPERLALEYAERMTSTPPTVERELVDRLSGHFQPAQIVEMAAIIAWENYRARINVGLGVDGHGFYPPSPPKVWAVQSS
jgi:alkylhydroperoxidase family enzyme